MKTKTIVKWLLAAGAAAALSSCVDTYGGGPGYGYGGGYGGYVETLPGGYEPLYYGGQSYYFSDGRYYRRSGGRYIIVERPRGYNGPIGRGWEGGHRPGGGGWDGPGRPGGPGPVRPGSGWNNPGRPPGGWNGQAPGRPGPVVGRPPVRPVPYGNSGQNRTPGNAPKRPYVREVEKKKVVY